MPILLSNYPAGSSTKQFLHYAQGIQSNKFRQFNLGRTKNLAKFGTPEPPDYNLSRVIAPVALWYASNDWLVSPKVYSAKFAFIYLLTIYY